MNARLTIGIGIALAALVAIWWFFLRFKPVKADGSGEHGAGSGAGGTPLDPVGAPVSPSDPYPVGTRPDGDLVLATPRLPAPLVSVGGGFSEQIAQHTTGMSSMTPFQIYRVGREGI